ncbi:MAG: OmpA family protein [Alphaproteobacteria bacterium]|nr:OmpA family protein [Alphaproteobacteria bacterium]MBF0128463.1 OmpA family protein [Alphaproteobacteria bacterium]
MNVLKVALSATCLAGLVAAAGPAFAQGVKMYDAPPSVEELKNALGAGGRPATGQGKVKFRKLEFGDEAPSSPPAAGPKAAPAMALQTPSSSYDAAPPSGGGGGAQAIGFPINFAYNSAEIDPASRPFLDTVGQLLSQQPDMRLVIEGHTDASGSPSYNLGLSERRAASVKRYLTGRYGISPSRLTSVGKGQSEPLTPSDAYSPQNRRVQFRTMG